MRMVEYVRKNFASLSPDDIEEGTLIVSTARGSYPWLNTEVSMVIVDEEELTPSEELFDDFQEAKKQFIANGYSNGLAHTKAWIAVDYEERFLEELPEPEDLPDYNDYKKVIFSCWCATKSPCHTDILVDYFSEEDTSQTKLFESFEVEDEEEEVEDVSKTTINPRTSFIANKPGLVSSYNPKMLTVTYLGMSPFQYTPMQVCKPDPKELYGGTINFEPSLSMGGVNPRTLGHCDDDGNYVRITPKDIGMKKNAEAKSHYLAYTFYQKIVADGEVIESIVCKSNREESL